MAATFNYYTPTPPGDWVAYKAHVELAGSQHVSGQVNDFIRSTRHLRAGVEDPTVRATREPTNAFDRNAIRIDAEWAGRNWTLGYLPRQIASDIARDHGPEMPLGVELIHVRYSGDGVYVKVKLLIPSSRSRKEHGWNLTS